MPLPVQGRGLWDMTGQTVALNATRSAANSVIVLCGWNDGRREHLDDRVQFIAHLQSAARPAPNRRALRPAAPESGLPPAAHWP